MTLNAPFFTFCAGLLSFIEGVVFNGNDAVAFKTTNFIEQHIKDEICSFNNKFLYPPFEINDSMFCGNDYSWLKNKEYNFTMDGKRLNFQWRHLDFDDPVEMEENGIEKLMGKCQIGNRKNEICFVRSEDKTYKLPKKVLGRHENIGNESDILLNFDTFIKNGHLWTDNRKFRVVVIHELLHSFYNEHSTYHDHILHHKYSSEQYPIRLWGKVKKDLSCMYLKPYQ